MRSSFACGQGPPRFQNESEMKKHLNITKPAAAGLFGCLVCVSDLTRTPNSKPVLDFLVQLRLEYLRSFGRAVDFNCTCHASAACLQGQVFRSGKELEKCALQNRLRETKSVHQCGTLHASVLW